MEDTGPEAIKRPKRLESLPIDSHRMHQQRSEPPLPLPLHNHPGGQALRPPSAYSQPPPPSPYDAPPDSQAPHEHPPSGSYGAHYPGYTAPRRDHRPPGLEAQSSLSRHGHPTPTRSPDEMQHGTAPRPLVTKFESEPQHYPISQPHEHVDPGSAYVRHESNGMYHAMPLNSPLRDHSQVPPAQGTVPVYGEAHRQYSPHSAGPFSGTPGGAPWVNRQLPPPRKNTRAQQACETCRQRKAKCDEGKPICGYCKENAHPCRYKEVQPAKADRAQKEIMDSLKENREETHVLTERMAGLEAQMHEMLKALGKAAGVTVDRVKEPEEEVKHDFTKESETENSTPVMARRSPVLSPRPAYQPMDMDAHSAAENEPTEIASGSVLVIHATAAHRLLSWPTVQRLLEGHPGAQNQDYVIQHEERKGLLRPYGKGQGVDRWDGAGSGGPGSPASSISSSPSTSSSDIYGVDLGLPNMSDGRFFNNQIDHPGGLNKDGTLKLDRSTMSRLERSYLDKMHIMHPFLDKTRLRKMIERVQAQANQSEIVQTRWPHIPSSGGSDPVRSLKRKHSSGDSPPDSSVPVLKSPEQALERRISTAIVLFVMALGKICEYTDPLPGPVPEIRREQSNTGTVNSPYSHTPSPATTISSPPAVTEQRLSSLNHRGPSSGWTSSPYRKNDRNVDVIPGLAYFVRAAEIMGTVQGNDLSHIQANLLAGLYMSQLACTIESWTWITNACRICHFLIRDGTFSKESDRTRIEMIRFAFWTCLQLESDILAELDLKPSGIQTIDPIQVPYPSSVIEDVSDSSNIGRADGKVIHKYYLYQLLLRKDMNEFQEILYPPDRYQPTEGFSLKKRDYCDSMLCDWRKVLPSELQWNDADKPAKDINAARLRGKYYGAKYIIHRPFLFYTLKYMKPEHITREVMEIYDRWELNPDEVKLEVAPESAGPEEEGTWNIAQILISCRLCVNAAKASTVVFDSVWKKSRPIVTNIFGTAHAQFGNMLVIAAVVESENLSWLVDKGDALRLLDRTIRFLRSLAPISTTLGTDASLLQTIRGKIDSKHVMGSSFSSAG